MEISDIHNMACDLLDEHGLSDWYFKWDQSRRRAGQCRYQCQEIGLSYPIFAIEENRPHARETVLHEIAHALAGPMAGHGPLWRVVARDLGVQPRATTARLTLPTENAWHGTCRCDTVHIKYRLSKRHTWRCNTCGETVSWHLA